MRNFDGTLARCECASTHYPKRTTGSLHRTLNRHANALVCMFLRRTTGRWRLGKPCSTVPKHYRTERRGGRHKILEHNDQSQLHVSGGVVMNRGKNCCDGRRRKRKPEVHVVDARRCLHSSSPEQASAKLGNFVGPGKSSGGYNSSRRAYASQVPIKIRALAGKCGSRMHIPRSSYHRQHHNLQKCGAMSQNVFKLVPWAYVCCFRCRIPPGPNYGRGNCWSRLKFGLGQVCLAKHVFVFLFACIPRHIRLHDPPGQLMSCSPPAFPC